MVDYGDFGGKLPVYMRRVLTFLAISLQICHVGFLFWSLCSTWSSSRLLVPSLDIDWVLYSAGFWDNVGNFWKSGGFAIGLSVCNVVFGVGQPLCKVLLYPLFVLREGGRGGGYFEDCFSDNRMRKMLFAEECHSKNVVVTSNVGVIMLSCVSLVFGVALDPALGKREATS